MALTEKEKVKSMLIIVEVENRQAIEEVNFLKSKRYIIDTEESDFVKEILVYSYDSKIKMCNDRIKVLEDLTNKMRKFLESEVKQNESFN